MFHIIGAVETKIPQPACGLEAVFLQTQRESFSLGNVDILHCKCSFDFLNFAPRLESKNYKEFSTIGNRNIMNDRWLHC
jgi:hypothetical protein